MNKVKRKFTLKYSEIEWQNYRPFSPRCWDQGTWPLTPGDLEVSENSEDASHLAKLVINFNPSYLVWDSSFNLCILYKVGFVFRWQSFGPLLKKLAFFP